eukprot:6707919-Alexandrium_andersonii.AAC.1
MSAGWVISCKYLQCLLDAERLADIGVNQIPHGQPDVVYERLLQGHPWDEEAAAAALPPPARRRRLQLLQDGEGDLATDGAQAA